MNDEAEKAKRGQNDSARRPAEPGPAEPASHRARKPAAKRSPGEPGHLFPIVGVGASAGGLEAMTELLTQLPPDTNMAFVLIQHLAPQHHTILPEILSRHTKMPVVLVENDMEVRPNSVYIIPPDTNMTVAHGHLNLTERSLVGGMHLPVDHFLRSLAADQSSRAIGVILSGSASDGALGLAAVKAEGGITFAQEPATARYDGMPSAAIAANAADFVLPPNEIAAELARLGQHRYLRPGSSPAARREAESATVEADALTKIFVTLRNAFRVDFGNYRSSTIRRRIDRRMALLKMDSLDEYAAYLRDHHDEVEELYHDVLIMVTEFFREPEVYDALQKDVLPKIVAAKHDDDQIRFWVPGCATGEEPYSLALCIVKALKDAGRDFPVKIFATDISERDIDKARSGLFAENKIQMVPDEFLHFFAKSDGGYRISKAIRDLCIFARHDVTSDPPFSQLDLVSCRNLLIYLDQSAQERVLPIFHYALHPGGHLVLGSSESIGSAADLFAPLDVKHKIFLRKEAGRRPPADFAYPFTLRQELEMGRRTERKEPEAQRHDPQRVADEILLSEFTPPAVVIDEQSEIVRFHGDTDRYLKPPRGRASLNLLDMARDDLASQVVSQVEDTAQASQEQGDRAASRERREIEHLERELAATREYCQSLSHEKEAAFEELRAANEEIQSSNEELQSINEELETAKEELQSTNEELRTVNEELENRNLQLSRVNDDLNNLLRAVSVPTIMVGRDLRVRRFTPGAERVMNLIATDVGRPITDIAPRLALDDLESVLRDAIDNAVVRDREIQDEQGRWHSMRIRPYQTEENRIEGAIITLVDIDDLRRALARATEVSLYTETVRAMMTKLRGGVRSAPRREAILGQAMQALGADAALLLRRADGGWAVEHARGLIETGADRVITDEELPQARMAEASAGPVSVRVGVNEVLRPTPRGLVVGAIVVVPVFEGERVTGVLAFTWQTADSPPTEEQLDFAATTASIVAVAQGHPRSADGDGRET